MKMCCWLWLWSWRVNTFAAKTLAIPTPMPEEAPVIRAISVILFWIVYPGIWARWIWLESESVLLQNYKIPNLIFSLPYNSMPIFQPLNFRWVEAIYGSRLELWQVPTDDTIPNFQNRLSHETQQKQGGNNWNSTQQWQGGNNWNSTQQLQGWQQLKFSTSKAHV